MLYKIILHLNLLCRLFVILLGEKLTADFTFGNFTQGDHRWLIVFFRHQGFKAFGGQLTGALGSQHHQLKAVINVFETIFNSNSCHNIPDIQKWLIPADRVV